MPNYGVVVSATGCGEDIDDDGNPITINAVAVYGTSAVDTACPPACLPTCLPAFLPSACLPPPLLLTRSLQATRTTALASPPFAKLRASRPSSA